MLSKKINPEDRNVQGLKTSYKENDHSLEADIWRTLRNIKKLKVKIGLAATATDRRRLEAHLEAQRGFLESSLTALDAKHKKKTATPPGPKDSRGKDEVIETAAWTGR